MVFLSLVPEGRLFVGGILGRSKNQQLGFERSDWRAMKGVIGWSTREEMGSVERIMLLISFFIFIRGKIYFI
jgi:hypothetical protein